MNFLKDTITTKDSKQELKKKGFRYDSVYSTKECECYKYTFSVDEYNKIPTIICIIRVYMDNMEVTVDVYNHSGNIYPAWYQRNNRGYIHHKNYIKKIDNKIFDKIQELNLLYKGAEE